MFYVHQDGLLSQIQVREAKIDGPENPGCSALGNMYIGAVGNMHVGALSSMHDWTAKRCSKASRDGNASACLLDGTSEHLLQCPSAAARDIWLVEHR